MNLKEHKILIANRGEIAYRIAKACKRLGIAFVCIYTEEDSTSGHVSLARSLGGDLCRVASYHDANEILSVADHTKATAIHPGYGFFAEDFRFAHRVVMRDRNMEFIGPSWRVIRALGDKINTKRLARSIDVPTIPGSDRPIYEEAEAETIASYLFEFQTQEGIGHPIVLVKASAGGGGMGIEEVYDMDQFRSVYRRIRNYAIRHFKDDGVLIEQRITDFNHLEVQIVSDRSGKHPVHFGTRNCSIQSIGLQKRIEVAPGFAPDDIPYDFDAKTLMSTIINHSLALAKKVGYDSVGTWEWIVTKTGRPFLMEVNTRIQVENGISSSIARIKGRDDVDLIAEQIRLALGDPMGYTQDDISFEGFSMEYRLIAESPTNHFAPWVGRIDKFAWTEEPWLTVHTHVPTALSGEPYDIPTDFDPNLALAIVKGHDLNELKRRGIQFLDSLVLEGVSPSGRPIESDISFLRSKTEDILHFTTMRHD